MTDFDQIPPGVAFKLIYWVAVKVDELIHLRSG